MAELEQEVPSLCVLFHLPALPLFAARQTDVGPKPRPAAFFLVSFVNSGAHWPGGKVGVGEWAGGGKLGWAGLSPGGMPCLNSILEERSLGTPSPVSSAACHHAIPQGHSASGIWPAATSQPQAWAGAAFHSLSPTASNSCLSGTAGKLPFPGRPAMTLCLQRIFLPGRQEPCI